LGYRKEERNDIDGKIIKPHESAGNTRYCNNLMREDIIIKEANEGENRKDMLEFLIDWESPLTKEELEFLYTKNEIYDFELIRIEKPKYDKEKKKFEFIINRCEVNENNKVNKIIRWLIEIERNETIRALLQSIIVMIIMLKENTIVRN